MSEDELKRLKEEIKQEVLMELEESKATRSIPPGISKVKAKWMYGPDSRDRYTDSMLDKVFGTSQHKVWDAVRTLVRLIFSKGHQNKLMNVDQELLEHVCEELFETVYRLRQEVERKVE